MDGQQVPLHEQDAALDDAERGIRVNAVRSGPVETPLLAKGTGGDPHGYTAFVPTPDADGPVPNLSTFDLSRGKRWRTRR